MKVSMDGQVRVGKMRIDSNKGIVNADDMRTVVSNCQIIPNNYPNDENDATTHRHCCVHFDSAA